MHHGEIKVASTLGEGTTFDVRVPLSYIKEEA
jgi:signal transduction histidine kinase